jgi:hypothetical protein
MEIDRMQYSAQPMNGIKFQLTNMMNVNYQVEFIDTWTGDIVSTIEVQSSNGSLTIEVPDFTKDIAVKIITK